MIARKDYSIELRVKDIRSEYIMMYGEPVLYEGKPILKKDWEDVCIEDIPHEIQINFNPLTHKSRRNNDR